MEEMLGVLGGMGPQATSVFYERLIARTAAKKDQEHLPTLIYSDVAMPDRTQAILSGNVEPVYARLKRDAQALAAAGCTCLALTCNTAHYLADRLQEELSVPLLHMPRLAVHRARAMGYGRVAILATEGAISAGVYQRECERVGLAYWVPDKATQQAVTALIYDQIKAGLRGEEATFAAIDAAARDAACDGAILACTELSVYRDYHPLGKFYLDAMEVLVEEAILACGHALNEA